ncbi:MAG: hypothetical protein AAF600_06960 [Bacteroidota bacterium]
MESIPSYVEWTFVGIVVSVLTFIVYAFKVVFPARKNLTLFIVILTSWIFLISIQTVFGFFEDFSFPPRLMIYVGIPVLSTIILLLTPHTRKFLNEMPITTLHYIHIIRVPVEMVLWWLSIFSVLPKELTFEGSNLDIISGISAPFAAVFLVGRQGKNRIGAILWNLFALGLLLHIVYLAVSFTPYFYEASQNTPANTGIFYFPYILLPTFIVPVVFFSHLAALNQLIFKKYQSQF